MPRELGGQEQAFDVLKGDGAGGLGGGRNGVVDQRVQVDPGPIAGVGLRFDLRQSVVEGGLPVAAAHHRQLPDRPVDVVEDRLEGADDVLEPVDAVAQPVVDQRLHGVAKEVVVDVHHAVPLPDPVDAADSLLDAHGVPRHVVVDQHAAGLEIQPLAGRLGAQEQPDGVAGPELLLDVLLIADNPACPVPGLAAPPGVAGDPGAVDGQQAVPEVVHGVGVLGEQNRGVVGAEDGGELVLEELQLGVDGQRVQLGDEVVQVRELLIAGVGGQIRDPFGGVHGEIVLLDVLVGERLGHLLAVVAEEHRAPPFQALAGRVEGAG